MLTRASAKDRHMEVKMETFTKVNLYPSTVQQLRKGMYIFWAHHSVTIVAGILSHGQLTVFICPKTLLCAIEHVGWLYMSKNKRKVSNNMRSILQTIFSSQCVHSPEYIVARQKT